MASEILHEKIFTLIIVIFIFGTLLYFVNQQATGKLIEKQTIAKEICLITLSVRPGTNVIVQHDSSLIIEKQDNGILVNDEKAIIGKGYFYDCYGNFEINSLDKGKTEVVVK